MYILNVGYNYYKVFLYDQYSRYDPCITSPSKPYGFPNIGGRFPFDIVEFTTLNPELDTIDPFIDAPEISQLVPEL